MKLLKNKSAKFFILMISIAAIIVMITALFVIGRKMDAEPIGKRAFSIFQNYQNAEDALIYLDSAALLSSHQSIIDVALSHKTDCGEYLGFSSWSNEEKECFPKKESLENDFSLKNSENIKIYLASYKDADLKQDYVFSVIEPFTVIGVPERMIYSGGKILYEVVEIPELTISQEELKERIVKKAEEIGVPKDIALALAYTESRLMHTKDDRVIVGTTGDVGVFQINVKVHRDCAIDDEDAKKELLEKGYWKGEKRVRIDGICVIPECEEKTVVDVDCNIAAGLRYLKKLRDASREPIVYCSGIAGLEKTYTDPWQIALRKYNGLGCIPALAQYVEIVEANRRAFA